MSQEEEKDELSEREDFESQDEIKGPMLTAKSADLLQMSMFSPSMLTKDTKAASGTNTL